MLFQDSNLTTDKPLAPQPEDTVMTERLQICDAIGEIIGFWGFKRVLGRTWTLLYLSSEPVSAAVISKTLQLSTGATHSALQEMESWGILIKKQKPGSKQYLYEAESRIWKIVCRVITQRELNQLEKLSHSLVQSLTTLENLRRDLRSNPEDLRYMISQLKKLASLVDLGTEGFRILFTEKNFGLSSLHKIAQIRKWFEDFSRSKENT